MEKVRLGDISKMINGDRGKNYPSQADITGEGEIPFVNAGHLNGRDIDFSEMNYISQDKYDKLSSGKFQEGDILYCLRGSIGKKAIVNNDVNGAIASSLVIIRPDIEKVCVEYLMFALDSPVIKEQLVKANNGSSQPNLSAASVREYIVELPELSVQKEIVEKLVKVRGVIDSRQKELQLLEDLIRARFVEMFGDIKTNEHGWEKCTFKDVSTKITDGEHGTVPRVDESEGYLYFMARNITKEGKIDLSETSFVPRENHEKIYKRCNPEKDDLLLVCVGATIGKCTLVPEIMGEFSMARSVALIKPNKERVTSNFLINLLRSEAIQNDIDHCSHAAAQAGLYTNMINSLEAFVPPMDFQIEFDTFSEQVDKSKFTKQIDSHVS